MKTLTSLLLAAMVIALSSCMSFRADPGERIVGQWRTQVGGFPVTVEYSEEAVQVANYQPVRYQLDGNELTFQQGGSQTRVVAFPSRNEMIQTDPMTGTEHRFVRVSDGG